MPIRFILMVNKQGQTRLAQYYETMTIREKSTLESEMIRKCLARGEDQVSLTHRLSQLTRASCQYHDRCIADSVMCGCGAVEWPVFVH